MHLSHHINIKEILHIYKIFNEEPSFIHRILCTESVVFSIVYYFLKFYLQAFYMLFLAIIHYFRYLNRYLLLTFNINLKFSWMYVGVYKNAHA